MKSASVRARRDASIWTKIHPFFALGQLGAFVVSIVLLGMYFAHAGTFSAVYLSVLIKCAFMVGAIVTGSLWEHDVFGPWWFAKEFFTEDVLTAGVFVLHVAFFIAIFTLPGNLEAVIATLIVAYGAYGLNVAQYIVKHVAMREPAGGDGQRSVA